MPAATRAATAGTGSLRRFSNLTGTLRLHVRGFGFVATPNGDVYCPSSVLGGLLDGDVVDVRAWSDGDRSQASRVTVRTRTRSSVFGLVGPDGMLQLDPAVGSGRLAMVQPVATGSAVSGTLTPAGVVPVSVFSDPWSFDAVRARSFCRHLLALDVPTASGPAPSVAALSPSGRRRDLRSMVTLTIDDTSSRDLDDALSVLPAEPDGTMRVLVHISDVAEHVTPHSPVDLQARETATSTYLPGWVRPMLPPSWSDDSLSLLPGLERDALTVEMRIDQVGAVRSVDVYESRICSNGRIDYTAAGRLLRGETPDGVDAEVAAALRWLRTAASRLACQRALRGGLSARVADPELRGEDRAAGLARDLIERLMVVTNEAVGRWLTDRGAPGMFRVHDEPDAEAVAEITQFAARLGFHTGFGPSVTPLALAALDAQFAGAHERVIALWNNLVQRLGRARYQAQPAVHFWLGSDCYVHFTSPIRRYADLVVHRVVKAYLDGERGVEALAERAGGDISMLASHVTERSRAAAAAERDVRRMMAAVSASGVSPRRALSGEVTVLDARGATVWLDGLGFQALLPFDGSWAFDGTSAMRDGLTLRPGDHVDVHVALADPVTGTVNVRPASRERGSTGGRPRRSRR